MKSREKINVRSITFAVLQIMFYSLQTVFKISILKHVISIY